MHSIHLSLCLLMSMAEGKYHPHIAATQLGMQAMQHDPDAAPSEVIPPWHPQQALAGAGEDQWAPTVVAQCPHGGARHLAPCLAKRFNAKAEQEGSPTRIVTAEELLFPDFSVRLPYFPNATHKRRWLPETLDLPRTVSLVLDGRVLISLSENTDRGSYVGQAAQNLVYANAVYRGAPAPDIWQPGSCMHNEVRHDIFTVTREEDRHLRGQATRRQLQRGAALAMSRSMHQAEAAGQGAGGGEGDTPRWQANAPSARYGARQEHQQPVFDELVLATSPDSWSYQHFHDRVINFLLQPRPHLTPGVTTVVTGRKPDSRIVSELWRALLQLPANTTDDDLEQHFVRAGQRPTVFANRLVHSCRSLLIHPWFMHGFRKLLGLSFPPQEQRKTLLYLTRGTPDGAGNAGLLRNGGRRVVNEAALLRAIQDVLVERGKGEQLVVFKPTDYPDLHALATVMASVTAVIGPHGGAFPCLNYAPPQTLVFEFLPRRFLGYYEIATVLDMPYWAFMYEPINPKNDMIVDVREVVKVLRLELGQTRPPSLQPRSAWTGALVR